MKENWSGTVALQSGEIGDDFATILPQVNRHRPQSVSVYWLIPIIPFFPQAA